MENLSQSKISNTKMNSNKSNKDYSIQNTNTLNKKELLTFEESDSDSSSDSSFFNQNIDLSKFKDINISCKDIKHNIDTINNYISTKGSSKLNNIVSSQSTTKKTLNDKTNSKENFSSSNVLYSLKAQIKCKVDKEEDDDESSVDFISEEKAYISNEELFKTISNLSIIDEATYNDQIKGKLEKLITVKEGSRIFQKNIYKFNNKVIDLMYSEVSLISLLFLIN